MNERLQKQLKFLHEIDALKTVFRRTNLIKDPSRLENTAEHSWHIAIYAMLLAEHANEPVDIAKVIKMLLIHDIVEIDAGDTFCYDETGNNSKEEREQNAADRIFGLLPNDQSAELRALWDEFEQGTSAEAKFAVTIDRIQPMLHNCETDGGSWVRHNIVRAQVEKRIPPIKAGSTIIGEMVDDLLDNAVEREILGA